MNFFDMLLIITIPLILATGITAKDPDCHKPVHSVCESGNIPRNFPETREELDNLCIAGIEYLDCAVNYFNSCSPAMSEEAKTYLDVVNEVCDKNSLPYAAVGDNLKCIKGFTESPTERQCYERSRNSEEVEDSVKNLIEQRFLESDEEKGTRQCLRDLHDVACVATKLGKECGEDAMNAFVEFVRILSPVNRLAGCDEEILEVLPIIIDIYKLEEDTENALKK